MNDFGSAEKQTGHGVWLACRHADDAGNQMGYRAVNDCDESPEASYGKIIRQIRRHYPTADEAAIRKVMGIRK